MSRRAGLVGLAGLLLGGAAPRDALPPLAACKAPPSAYEARLCADKELRVFPLAMERLLAAARARVSPEGQRLLAAGQESWRGFLPMICPILPEGRPLRASDRECVARGFAARIKTVLDTGQPRGPYVFQRVETLSTTQRPGLPSRTGLPYAMHQLAYPRLDRPANAAAQAWNARVRRTFPPGAPCEADRVDTSLDYELGLVTRRLIGLSWNAWIRCDPTEDGTGRRLTETWVLDIPPRPLTSADLFRPGSAWTARLSDAAVQVVGDAAKAKGYAPLDLDRARIGAAAIDPERWVLRREGIGFVFSELELGVGAAFLPAAVVPWARLRDVMNPGALQ